MIELLFLAAVLVPVFILVKLTDNAYSRRPPDADMVVLSRLSCQLKEGDSLSTTCCQDTGEGIEKYMAVLTYDVHHFQLKILLNGQLQQTLSDERLDKLVNRIEKETVFRLGDFRAD